jgi:hypothetical protein
MQAVMATLAGRPRPIKALVEGVQRRIVTDGGQGRYV